MRKLLCVGAVLAGVSLCVAEGIQTTGGEMLLDLDASNFAELLQEGESVVAWPNAGSEPDFAFVATHDNSTNPTFQLRDGVPVVRFSGSSTGSLTNGVPTPQVLLGNQAWTVETWLCPNKTVTDSRDWLSLTANEGLEDNNFSMAEFRVDQANGVAVEHSGQQLKWGRRTDTLYRPKLDEWCNIVVVHEANGYERVYMNGRATSFANRTLAISDAEPSFIVVSGNYNRAPGETDNPYRRQAYADIAVIRVQTGALTAPQVLANFNAEKGRYGVTTTPDALWTDDGTWFAGRAPEPGDNLILEGNQPLVYDNGVSNSVNFLTVNAAKGTGLTIDNGSELYVAYDNNLTELGAMSGGSFALDVKSGRFVTPGNSFTVGMYGAGLVSVGGQADASAAIECGSSLRLGVLGGTGELTVKTNGVLTTASDFYLSDGTESSPVTATIEAGGSITTAKTFQMTNGVMTVKGGGTFQVGTTMTLYRDTQLTVEAGGYLKVAGSVYLARQTGPTVFDLYGTFDQDTENATTTFYLTGNEEGATGTFNLYPGAVANIQSVRTYDDVTTTTATINADTATICGSRVARTWLLPPQVTFNFKNEVTLAAGLDPASTLVVTNKIGTTIHDLTEEGVGTIVKAGPGVVLFTNDGVTTPSEISSRFAVREGRLVLAAADVFAAGFDGSFLLEGGEIEAPYSGGAAFVLARLDPASKGRFVLTANNADENLDFSNYPDVEVVTSGTFIYRGTIKPVNNKYVFRPTNGEMVYAGDIMDVGGVPATVEIYGATETDGVTLSGTNDGMSGSISIYKGILGISGTTDAAGGATSKLYLAEGTSLKLDARVGKTFLATRLDPASKPAAILLTELSAGCDIDLSQFPGCRLGPGTTNAVVHTGTLLPTADNNYLLGGGSVSYWRTNFRGLTPATLVDVGGDASRVFVGLSGLINLSNAANTYSGGTEVTDGAAVFASADGFGQVPEEFDEGNIYLNGGVVRSGPDTNTITLAPTRGVKVGPEGAELHPWGNSTLDIQGGLTGAGALAVTDQGHLTFSGAHNTFKGSVTVGRAESVITIGGDEHFSWASEGGLTVPGTVVLQNPADATFNDTISGAASLYKRGAGTLTVTKPQAYTGATAVEGGTLVLANGASLQSSSLRNDGEIVFSSIDALGSGKISGSGLFTVLEGGSMQLDGSRINGDPNFKVQKDATLEIDSPDISARAEITAADGANLSLGAASPNAAEGLAAFVCNGTAEKTADGAIRLTPATSGAIGSAFFGTRVKIAGSWEAEVAVQVGAHGTVSKTEACGIGFVLQNDPAGKRAVGVEAGTVGVGCDFSVVDGAVMRLFDNGSLRNFFGFFSDYANTSAILATDGHLVKIKLTYDGATLVATYTDTVNGNVRTRTKTVDLKAALGSEYAWIGCTGFAGTEMVAEQFLRSFTFTRGAEAMPTDINTTDWALLQKASIVDLDGEQAIEIMPASVESERGCAWNRNRVRVDQPFTATFKYRVTEYASSGPGYGFTVVLQNCDNATYPNIKAYGEKNEKYGFVHTSSGRAQTNAVGYVVNIYNSQSLQRYKSILHNTISEIPSEQAGSGLASWNLCDGEDTQFTFRWDMTNLTITAAREGFAPHSYSMEMDVQTLVADRAAYFGFTGSSSSKWARQLIHDFHFAYDEIEQDDSTYANHFVVEGAAQLSLGVGTVGFSNLELQDGAELHPESQGSASELDLKGLTVAGDATVAASATVPVVLSNTIAFTGTKGTLTLTGDVRKAGEKILIDLADVAGVHKLIDMSGMDKPLTLNDFELTESAPQPIKLDIQNGVLRVWRDNSTVLIFR